MESFFLAETTKYLYLLFDPDNFIHNNGKEGVLIDTPNGECVVEAGGYIFNTEAHPIDPAALSCCYDLPREDMFANFNLDDYRGDVVSKKERKFDDLERFACNGNEMPVELKDANFTIDLQVAIDEKDPDKVSHDIAENFEKISAISEGEYSVKDVLALRVDGQISKDKLLAFIKKHKITKKEANETEGIYGAEGYPNEIETLETAYIFHVRMKFSMSMKEALSLDEKENKNSTAIIRKLKLFLEVLDHFKSNKSSNDLPKDLVEMYKIMLDHQIELENSVSDHRVLYFILTFARDIRNSSINMMMDDVPNENTNENKTEIEAELFDALRTIAILKKLLLESIEKLNAYKDVIETETKDESVQEQSDNHLNDDIILVDSKEAESKETSVDSSEDLILAPIEPEISRIEERSSSQITKPPKTTDSINNSLLTSFVDTIIKSTMPRKSTFDAQLFLQKIRANGVYNNVEQKYELLTCRAKPYAERFSYRTEIF